VGFEGAVPSASSRIETHGIHAVALRQPQLQREFRSQRYLAPQTEFEPAISWLTTQMEATIVRDRVSDLAAGLEPSKDGSCPALPVRERLPEEHLGIGPANRPSRLQSAGCRV
jgi:hypothetical protein